MHRPPRPGLIVTLVLAVLACDGEESRGGSVGSTSSTSDASAEAEGAETMQSASCVATAEFCCDPAGERACQNPDDCALVENGEAKEAAARCGVDCLGQDDACTRACMASSGLGEACGECIVDYGACLTMNCLAECLGATPDDCTQCSRTKPAEGDSCSDRFFACSGTVRNPDYQP